MSVEDAKTDGRRSASRMGAGKILDKEKGL